MTYDEAMQSFDKSRAEAVEWLRGVKQLDAEAIDAFVAGYQRGWLDCWRAAVSKSDS